MHDIAEFLGTHDPFTALEPAELESLAERVEIECFEAGSTIFRQGEGPPDAMWVLRTGAIELWMLFRRRPAPTTAQAFLALATHLDDFRPFASRTRSRPGRAGAAAAVLGLVAVSVGALAVLSIP